MTIEIISGSYGLRTKNGTELKNTLSGPFTVDDVEGKRLIALGVARQINSVTATVSMPVSAVKVSNDTHKKKNKKKGNSANANGFTALEAVMPE